MNVCCEVTDYHFKVFIYLCDDSYDENYQSMLSEVFYGLYFILTLNQHFVDVFESAP